MLASERAAKQVKVARVIPSKEPFPNNLNLDDVTDGARRSQMVHGVRRRQVVVPYCGASRKWDRESMVSLQGSARSVGFGFVENNLGQYQDRFQGVFSHRSPCLVSNTNTDGSFQLLEVVSTWANHKRRRAYAR